jgi:alpha-1,6-mannosyltransferase
MNWRQPGFRLLMPGLLLIAILTVPVLLTANWPVHRAVLVRIVGLILAFPAYLWAISLMRERPAAAAIWPVIVVVAVAARLAVLPADPMFSDDVYRYAWDARVQNAGLNPYTHAPGDTILAGLRDEAIWLNVNNRAIRTIYPPVAQALFGIFGHLSTGLLPMKLLAVLFDIGTFLVLAALLRRRGRPRSLALIYAWNPLVIVEFAMNGHMDSVPIFFLVLALHLVMLPDRMRSSVALALSAGSKLFALALWPFWWRRRPHAIWIVPAVMLLAYAPFSDAGVQLVDGLVNYGERWQSNEGGFAVVQGAVRASGLIQGAEPWRRRQNETRASRLIAVLIFGIYLVSLLWRSVGPTQASFHLVGAFLILSPTVHPWYVTWIIPFLCLKPERAWLLLSGLVGLAYLVLPGWLHPAGGLWLESDLVRACQWVPFAALLCWDWAKPHLRFMDRPGTR